MSHRHKLEKNPQPFTTLDHYRVFAVKFEHGWCWSRAHESHHSEPSPRWFGPYATEHEAQEEARRDGTGRRKWSVYDAGSLV